MIVNRRRSRNFAFSEALNREVNSSYPYLSINGWRCLNFHTTHFWRSQIKPPSEVDLSDFTFVVDFVRDLAWSEGRPLGAKETESVSEDKEGVASGIEFQSFSATPAPLRRISDWKPEHATDIFLTF